MTMLISFLSGWGLLISLLACAAGCVLRFRRCRMEAKEAATDAAGDASTDDSTEASTDAADSAACGPAAWRESFVPSQLREGIWPVRVLVNYFLCCMALLALVVLLFNPAHAVLLRDVLGFGWPSLSRHWADGLAVFVTLGVLFLPLRRLLIPELRADTGRREWLALALVSLAFLTGLLARCGVIGHEFQLFLHLVCGHVFLWCVPRCRFAQLLR